ncbi:hypothetical protein [Mycobacteroides chelonae]|nr:hypothetical protein [Mycobacteroides chelonae]
MLIVPDMLDAEGVVGCSAHPTTPSPTLAAITIPTRSVEPGRD